MGYTVSLASAASQSEGNTVGTRASFTFNLTRDAGEAGSINDYRYEIRNASDWSLATDFTSATGTFTWNLGVTTGGTFTIEAAHDLVVESSESFVVWIYEDEAAPNNKLISPLDPTNPPITLTLLNDDAAPVFSSSSSFSVAEGATAVGTAVASGNATLTYTLAGGADDGLFTLDPNTGVLVFGAAKNFETPDDAGANGVYNIKVQASDGVNATVQDVVVSLTNVNEAITVTTGAAFNVDENTTSVTTATKTDVDLNDTATWSISGGVDAAKFTINSSTGALSFVTAPDFEAPTDVGADNVYNVQITATDSGGLTDDQAIAVTVVNVVGSPVITSHGGGPVAFVNASENTTGTVTTFAATDEEGQAITYTRTGGADMALFSITAGGVLTFANPFSPNFEAPGDANGDNTYEVVVEASDGVNTDTQTLYVAVTNVSEPGDPAPPPGGGGGGGGGGSTSGPDNRTGTVGADTLAGGDGDDTLNGGDGADSLDGDNGADLLVGGDGADFIRGLNDNDAVFGGLGNDDVNGNLGEDFVDGGEGADTVRGGQGNDLVYGGDGDDGHVNGNIGEDQVFGGAGADTVYGGQGADTFYGEDGDDRLSGDLGNDILYGGAGADRFAIAAGGGVDWVGDFSFAAGDRIQLATGTTYTMVGFGGQVTIVLADGSTLGLANVSTAGFTSDWVVFG